MAAGDLHDGDGMFTRREGRYLVGTLHLPDNIRLTVVHGDMDMVAFGALVHLVLNFQRLVRADLRPIRRAHDVDGTAAALHGVGVIILPTCREQGACRYQHDQYPFHIHILLMGFDDRCGDKRA